MAHISTQPTQDVQHVSRTWFILAIMCVPVFLGSLDLTVVSAFLPNLLNELGLTLDGQGLADVTWVLTSYLLSYSVSLFAIGRLSDFIGRRVALVICLFLYMLGALLVVFFEETASVLTVIYDVASLGFNEKQIGVHAIILGRIVSAFGAGAITSITIAVVSDLFPANRRAIPLGIVMALDTLGWLMGAAWGGVVVQFLPWKAIFLINIPLVLLAMSINAVMLKDVTPRKTQGRFDVVGFLIMTGMLTSLTLGLVSIDATGDQINISTALPMIGIAFGLAGILLVTQRRSASPLIAPDMIQSSRVASSTLINLLLGFCMFIPLVSVPLLINIQGLNEIGFVAAFEPILAEVLKDASLDTGILMAAFALPLALASIVGGWLINRIGTLYTLFIGLAFAVVGYGMVGLLLNIDMTNLQISVMMAVSGLGIGMASTPIIAATLGAVSDQQRGMASALLLGVRMIGMTIATSTLSTFGSQRINDLVASMEEGRFIFDLVRPEDYTIIFATTYINATVQTISEMSLIGLVGCFVAFLFALTIWRKKGVT